MTTPVNNPNVTFTLAAATKVKHLIEEEGNFNLKLRVFISGGGCSGFQYGFTFDENIAEDDYVVTSQDADVDDQGEEDGGEGGDDDQAKENSSEGGEGDQGGEDGGEGGGQVQLLIDPLSYQYLVGATIDYREDVHGAQFVITNPNAQTTCGCGHSFSA